MAARVPHEDALPTSARKRWETDAAETDAFSSSHQVDSSRELRSGTAPRPDPLDGVVQRDDQLSTAAQKQWAARAAATPLQQEHRAQSDANPPSGLVASVSLTAARMVADAEARPASARKRWEADARKDHNVSTVAAFRAVRVQGELEMRSAVLKRWTSHLFALPGDGSSLCAMPADGSSPATPATLVMTRDNVKSLRVVAGAAPSTRGELVFVKKEDCGGGNVTLRAPSADLERWTAALRAAGWPLAASVSAAAGDGELAALRVQVDTLTSDLTKWSGFIGAIEERVDGFVEESVSVHQSARAERRSAAADQTRLRSEFTALCAERDVEELLVLNAVNNEHAHVLEALRLEQRVELAAATMELRAQEKNASAQELAFLAQANVLRDEEIASCRAAHTEECAALVAARETLRAELAEEQRAALTNAVAVHAGVLASQRDASVAALDELRASAAVELEGSSAEHTAALERADALHIAALRRCEADLVAQREAAATEHALFFTQVSFFYVPLHL